MIKRLAWRELTAVSFVPKREPGEPTQLREKRLSDTTSEYTAVGSPTQPDKDEQFTFLKVRKEHIANLHPALCWYTGQNVPIPKVIETNGDMSTVRIFGEFAPALPDAEIHQMMLDYELLSPRFDSWQKVRALTDRHTIALSYLLLGVTQQMEGIKRALHELGNEEVSKRLKALDPLPRWALRFLEIRKQLRR